MASRSSTTEVVVGRIRKPHGVGGELLAEPTTDVAGRFDPGSRLTAALATGGRREVEIVASRPHKGGLLLKLGGIADRDAAETLRGALLEVDAARVPPAPEGSFYHFQLAGCTCIDRTAGELGEVVEVVEDGGGVLLLVSDGERRLPVPFVGRFVESVDVEGGEIRLDLPEGLIEICASKS